MNMVKLITIKRHLCRKRTADIILIYTLVICIFLLWYMGQKYYKRNGVNEVIYRRGGIRRHPVMRTFTPKNYESLNPDFEAGCHVLYFNPFDEEIEDLFVNLPQVKCNKQNWVKCNFSSCKIDDDIVATVENVICTYRDILYVDEKNYKYGPPAILKGKDTFEFRSSDHVLVRCAGNWDDGKAETRWSGRVTGIRSIVNIKPGPSYRRESLNVLLLVWGSTSRNGFIRRMPKTFKLINELGFTVLEGFNTLGNTPEDNIFPLLTGRRKTDFKPVWDLKSDRHLNLTSFLFHILGEDGYRTAYLEDNPTGTFEKYNGFNTQPAHHYLKPLLMSAFKRKNKNEKCLGETPIFDIILNSTYQLFKTKGKKFCLAYINSLTAENFDLIASADDSTVNFLKKFKDKGFMEDTLVVIMGDYGSNNENILVTEQGRSEQRLPLLAIQLPAELRPSNRILQRNVKVLTTPFDVHATILDAVGLTEYISRYKVEDQSKFCRGISVLNVINPARSCYDAEISAKWCSCPMWIQLDETDALYMKAVTSMVNYINNFTADSRDLCRKLDLSSVISVSITILPSDETKEKMYDNDGKPVNDNMNAESINIYETFKEYYKIKLILSPSLGIYEALSIYKNGEFMFYLDGINVFLRKPQTCPSKTHHAYKLCVCVKRTTPTRYGPFAV